MELVERKRERSIHVWSLKMQTQDLIFDSISPGCQFWLASKIISMAFEFLTCFFSTKSHSMPTNFFFKLVFFPVKKLINTNRISGGQILSTDYNKTYRQTNFLLYLSVYTKEIILRFQLGTLKHLRSRMNSNTVYNLERDDGFRTFKEGEQNNFYLEEELLDTWNLAISNLYVYMRRKRQNFEYTY